MNISGKAIGYLSVSAFVLSSCTWPWIKRQKDAHVYFGEDWIPLSLVSDPSRPIGKFQGALEDRDLVFTLDLNVCLTMDMDFSNLAVRGRYLVEEDGETKEMGGQIVWTDVDYPPSPIHETLSPSRIYNGFLFEGKRYREPDDTITLSAGRNRIVIPLCGEDWAFAFVYPPGVDFEMDRRENFTIFSSELCVGQAWREENDYPDFFFIRFIKRHETRTFASEAPSE